jgi:hypothetical protein
VHREVDSAQERKKLRFLHLVKRLTEEEEQKNGGKRKIKELQKLPHC